MKLVISCAGKLLEEFHMVKPLIRIGRSAGSDVVLDGRTVSLQHAVIEALPNGWELRDAGSTNGTLVNGREIAWHRLRIDDELAIGNFRLRWRDEHPTERRRSARDIAEAAAAQTVTAALTGTGAGAAPGAQAGAAAGPEPAAALRISQDAGDSLLVALTAPTTPIKAPGVHATVSRHAHGYVLHLSMGVVFFNGELLAGRSVLLSHGDTIRARGLTASFVEPPSPWRLVGA